MNPVYGEVVARWRLETRCIRGFFVKPQLTEKFCWLRPREAAYILGIPNRAHFSHPARYDLALLGLVASPLQVIWVYAVCQLEWQHRPDFWGRRTLESSLGLSARDPSHRVLQLLPLPLLSDWWLPLRVSRTWTFRARTLPRSFTRSNHTCGTIALAHAGGGFLTVGFLTPWTLLRAISKFSWTAQLQAAFLERGRFQDSHLTTTTSSRRSW